MYPYQESLAVRLELLLDDRRVGFPALPSLETA
jgi:hypothetical protein